MAALAKLAGGAIQFLSTNIYSIRGLNLLRPMTLVQAKPTCGV